MRGFLIFMWCAAALASSNASTSFSSTTTSLPASTTAVLLDFTGAICNSGQACSNGAAIDQSYGDSAFLDVQYSSGVNAGQLGTVVAQGADWRYWSSYGGLSNVAYGGSDGSTMQQLYLRGNVRLNSFQMATYSGSGVTTEVRVVDAATGTVLFTQTASLTTEVSTLTGPWTSAVGIALQMGPDGYNAALSNVDFWVDESTGTIGATTATTTMPTSSVAPTTSLPASTTAVLLDFTGAICNSGQACSNGASIDQSYGDSIYLDVQYSAGLSASAAGSAGRRASPRASGRRAAPACCR